MAHKGTIGYTPRVVVMRTGGRKMLMRTQHVSVEPPEQHLNGLKRRLRANFMR